MKNLFILILSLLFSMTIISSCSDDDVKEAVDCLGENLLLSIDYTTASENNQQINFTLSYYGDKTLDKTVKWDFGNGAPVQTSTGTTTSYTYTAPGTYHVKANISLNNGNCSYDIHKTVNIR
ncbi:PKD domain-containing protein [Chishuiella changwenlii]|uniref:PKD domain-containing protein n=1 Tax=Chishuiella changwenlii TaxID=1434701 RepID=UPI002FD936DA